MIIALHHCPHQSLSGNMIQIMVLGSACQLVRRFQRPERRPVYAAAAD